jgi:hypothetical protein
MRADGTHLLKTGAIGLSDMAMVGLAPRPGAVCAIVRRSARATIRRRLGMMGIEEAVGRCALDHLGELPSEINGIPDANV